MGILDKIKGLLKGNKAAVTQGVDHADKIAAGADKVKDVINKID
jgi:hypothetical protein